MDLDLTSLLRNGFVCDSLVIQGLQLNLIRSKEKRYNLPDLFHPSRERQQGEIMDFAQLPFLFSLNNIDISDSRISYKDMVTGKTHSVEQLQLAIPTLSNFSFQSSNYIQPHFSAIVNGSPIQLSGEAVQVTKDEGFQTKLSCTIQSLDLVPYFSYLPSSFPLNLSRGRADTSLQIFFSPKQKHGSRLSIDIKMNADDIEMQTKNKALQLQAPALTLEGRLEPLTKRLHLRSIVAKETELSGRRDQLAAELAKLLPHPAAKDAPQFNLAVDLALLEQGRLTLLSEPKSGLRERSWQPLRLLVKNFNTAAGNDRKEDTSTATFHLSGEQENEQGSFSWQGTLSETGKIHGKLLLNEFPAATLFTFLDHSTPYRGTGRATLAGDLTLSPWQEKAADYTLTNGTLEIDNLELLQNQEKWLEARSVRLTHLSRTGGRLQLGDIFLKGATAQLHSNTLLPPSTTPPSAKGPKIELSSMDFSGAVKLKGPDKAAPELLLSDVHLQANNLDHSSPKGNSPARENFTLSAHLLPDGLLEAKGSVNLTPFRIQVNLAFSNMDSSSFSPFFSQEPLVRESKATLHGKGEYRYPKAAFQGNLRLTDTVLQHSPESPLLSWELADLHNVACRFSPFQLTAETLLLEGPQLQWQRSDDDPDPFQQLQEGLTTLLRTKVTPNSSGKEEELFPVTLKEITFQKGLLHYQDQRLSPAWSMTAENIEGRLKNIRSAERGLLSPFSLTGTLNSAPFNLSGAATLFPELREEGRAKLQLTDFPVASFREQLSSLPVNADSATLSLHLNMSKEESLFNSRATLFIGDLDPDRPGSDTALALALLKNGEGTFPMTVQLQDGEKTLLEEGMNSLQTTLIKATYAPLLLDPEFADLQDNTFLTFQPGDDRISPMGQETLSRYAELLAKHPDLVLAVRGMADRENDQQTLLKKLEEKEQQRVDEENRKKEAASREKQYHFSPLSPGNDLQEQDIAQDDFTPFKPVLPNPVSVRDEELLDLAMERSLLVYDFCTHSLAIPSQRILLESEGEIIERGPGNRVFLSLKTIPLASEK